MCEAEEGYPVECVTWIPQARCLLYRSHKEWSVWTSQSWRDSKRREGGRHQWRKPGTEPNSSITIEEGVKKKSESKELREEMKEPSFMSFPGVMSILLSECG